MHVEKQSGSTGLSTIKVEKKFIHSEFLHREVIVDFYIPLHLPGHGQLNLLLINDGQDLHKFHYEKMIDHMHADNEIEPVLSAGIHCGMERRMEYGTAFIPDYKGRGAKAASHQLFVFHELLPLIKELYYPIEFKEKAYAGFSLGGLSALDTVWHHPHLFSKTGVFSGSLWWRLKDLDKGYEEATDRIMHKLVREGDYSTGLQFYFTTGSLDEKMDRNNNGVIDSIDDTLALIEELEKKGYQNGRDICYINYENGRHDVHTWGKAMPDFLKWGWGKENMK
jgi:enterochelin esterase-like enzyme